MSKSHEHNEIACAIREGFSELAQAIDGLKPECSKPKGHFDISIGLVTRKENKPMAVAIKITNAQKVNVTLNPRTDSGKPAKLDGAPTWTVVDGESTVVVAADGLSADLISSDNPGDTTFLVDADADLGSGVEDLQETITLTVAGENAKNLGITVGEPTNK
jgi:hypothetical protein